MSSIENFLQIIDEAVTSNLNVHREVEYDMSETQIRDLLTHGSLDAFLDALDFAPKSVSEIKRGLTEQYEDRQIITYLMQLCMEEMAVQVSPGQFCIRKK